MEKITHVRYLGLDVLSQEERKIFEDLWEYKVTAFIEKVKPGDILSTEGEYTVKEFNDLKKSEFGSTILVDENRYRINFPVQLFEIVEECINSYDIW